MQLFRREKPENESKIADSDQTPSAVNWYERAEPESPRVTPLVQQPLQQPIQQDEFAVQERTLPLADNLITADPMPTISSVMNEQTRSTPTMSNIARENLPYPDLPVQGSTRQARATGQATVIDAQSHFNGNYRSDSDLIIEGAFEGEIECNGTVTVAQDATMSATVRARNVIVAGSANGEITCDERFSISATGEMRGKAQASTLVVEEGAFFEGEFRMGSSYSSASQSSSYGDWESARRTPVESSMESPVEYSMSVDESDLADLDEIDSSGADRPFSVDDVWDEGSEEDDGESER